MHLYARKPTSIPLPTHPRKSIHIPRILKSTKTATPPVHCVSTDQLTHIPNAFRYRPI